MLGGLVPLIKQQPAAVYITVTNVEHCSSDAGVLLVFCVYLTYWTYCEVPTAAQLPVSCVTQRQTVDHTGVNVCPLCHT